MPVDSRMSKGGYQAFSLGLARFLWHTVALLLISETCLARDVNIIKRMSIANIGQGSILATLGMFPSTEDPKDGSPSRTRPFIAQGDDTTTIHNLIQQAEKHAKADQVLAAARCLRKATTHDPHLLLDEPHLKVLELANRVEATIMALSKRPDPTIWTKQGEVHNEKRDIVVHYKLDAQRRLTSRIELLMDKSLLLPLASVLIETELYNTWVPRWRFPPVGVAHVRKIGQTGRTNQIIHASLDIPWRRDLIIASIGVEDVDENGLLAIHLGSYPAGEEVVPGLVIPPPEHGVVRIDFEGCFLFQKCPMDHPLLNQIGSRPDRDRDAESSPEDLILVGFSMFADAKISSLFPQSIVNFILRVAIVKFFVLFLNVAEDIQAGGRPDHTAAIAKKHGEIYDWIDERIQTMIEQLIEP